jgi:hypothetical protein
MLSVCVAHFAFLPAFVSRTPVPQWFSAMNSKPASFGNRCQISLLALRHDAQQLIR